MIVFQVAAAPGLGFGMEGELVHSTEPVLMVPVVFNDERQELPVAKILDKQQ